MSLTLVAVAAACAGVLLGGIGTGLRTRSRFARTAGAFRCRLRMSDAAKAPLRPPGIGARWGRRRSAVWVHDVLLVQHGLFGQHLTAVPVRIPEDAIRPVPHEVPRRLGPNPQALRLRLDDGPVVEIATTSDSRSLIAGPFLAAAIPGLPTAPADRPPRT
jgi:hypothetical protein